MNRLLPWLWRRESLANRGAKRRSRQMPAVYSGRSIRDAGSGARKHAFPRRPDNVLTVPASAFAARKAHLLITRLAVDQRLARIFFHHLQSELVRHRQVVVVVAALIPQKIQILLQFFRNVRVAAFDMRRIQAIRRKLPQTVRRLDIIRFAKRRVEIRIPANHVNRIELRKRFMHLVDIGLDRLKRHRPFGVKFARPRVGHIVAPQDDKRQFKPVFLRDGAQFGRMVEIRVVQMQVVPLAIHFQKRIIMKRSRRGVPLRQNIDLQRVEPLLLSLSQIINPVLVGNVRKRRPARVRQVEERLSIF